MGHIGALVEAAEDVLRRERFLREADGRCVPRDLYINFFISISIGSLILYLSFFRPQIFRQHQPFSCAIAHTCCCSVAFLAPIERATQCL